MKFLSEFFTDSDEWKRKFKINLGITDFTEEDQKKLDKAKKALKQYWDLRDEGSSKDLAADGSEKLLALDRSTQKLITSAKTREKAEKAITKELGQQTIAQKALNVAKSAGAKIGTVLLNVGVSFAISQIISWITELVNAKKEAEETARQEIETALDNAEAVESEIKALDSLNSSYLEAKTKSSDLTTQKKALSEVQKELAESLKMEKKELDGLIDGYGDYIELINNASTAQSEKWLNDNKYAIDLAEEEYKKAQSNSKEIIETQKRIDELYAEFGNDWTRVQNSITTGDAKSNQASELIELLDKQNQLKQSDYTLELDMGGKSGDWEKIQSALNEQFKGNVYFSSNHEQMYINGDLEKRLEILNWIKTNANAFEIDGSQYQMVVENIDKVSNSLELYNKKQQYTADNTRRQQLETIGFYDKVNEYEQALNLAANGENFAERYQNLKKSQDIYDELISLDGLTEGEIDYVNELKDSFDEVIFQAKNTSAAINTIFDEYKTNTYDSIKEDIETVNNAIEKILNNESLDETDILSLSGIDSDILNNLIKTTDGYTLSLQSLNEAKKEIIKTTSEEIKAQKDSLEAEIEVEKQTLALNEAKLEELKLKYQSLASAPGIPTSILQPVSDEIAEVNQQIQNSTDTIDTLYDSLNKFSVLDGSLKSFAESVDKISAEIVLSIMTDQFDAKISEIDKQISQLQDEQDQFQEKIDKQQELKESIEDRYDTEINKLKELNEEKENENKLEEARQRLEKAGQRTLRVWRSGVGWVWEQNQEELKEAQQEYDSALLDDKINKLEKAKEAEIKIIEDKIKELEDYSDEYYGNQIEQLNNSKDFYEESKQEYINYVDSINNEGKDLLAKEMGLTIALDGEYSKRADTLQRWCELYDSIIQTDAMTSNADSILGGNAISLGVGIGAANAINGMNIANYLTSGYANNNPNVNVNLKFGDIVTSGNPVDFMKQLEAYLRQAGIKSIIK